ncbi:MAG: ankyrin repeat domain-containing protein [Akkermansia sp.]|nr:ankyrin repeat domain-containing protein [Akkermansia sp.]
MKHIHIISALAAAGILLPTQHAAAFTSPIPTIAASTTGVNQGKKAKKAKSRKSKTKGKKSAQSVDALAKQIFNATDEQKQKAKDFLAKQGNPDIGTAIEDGNGKVVSAHLIIGETDLNEALCDCIEAGRNQYVKLLLASGKIDVNKKTYFGTPLTLALSNDNMECAKLLLAAPDFDADAYDPITLAIVSNDIDTVKKLIASGADVNSTKSDGFTPLYWAVNYKMTECVKLLLAAPGINVNIPNGRPESTALHVAADHGNAEYLKMLLAVPGIEVNKPDCVLQTPLHRAVQNNHIECVKLLLAAPGIEVNAYDWEERTPLLRAKSEEIQQLLKAAGAKLYTAPRI